MDEERDYGDDYYGTGVDLDVAADPFASERSLGRVNTALPINFNLPMGRNESRAFPQPARLGVLIQQPSRRYDGPFRTTAAGNMRLHDLVLELLPGMDDYDVRVFVKSQGTWTRPRLDTRFNDLIEPGYAFGPRRGGEMDIKLEILGGLGGSCGLHH